MKVFLTQSEPSGGESVCIVYKLQQCVVYHNDEEKWLLIHESDLLRIISDAVFLVAFFYYIDIHYCSKV